MKTEQAAIDFALAWWKGRHDQGYFPTMEQHLNWKVYECMEPWFLEFAEPTRDDEALEVGCGYGQWMHPLSRLVGSVAGIDIHPTLVEKANGILATCPDKNAFMKLSDGVSIPFQDDYFSLVYSISVFQHMPRAIVRRYLAEIARVLAPAADGGRAVLHFRHADGNGPYAADIEADHKGDWSVGWTLEEAQQECAAVGLRITREIRGQSLIIRAELNSK